MNIGNELNANEQNITALQTILAPSWVSAPSYRGTSSILWSCLVTLVACIYTAIHLNIPDTTSKWRILLIKGKWVLIALIAPEIVLYCAIHQWSEARKLVSGLNQLRKESEQARQQAPQDFDMGYAFFAVMGGLRVSTRAIAEKDDTMALNANGVLELARLGHIIYIPPTEIEDKSKAGLLQKVLIICQVLWMVVQCITRQIYGLPLTLLEIHTMVHVFCAILMYIFWFNKPLDIASPQLVDRDVDFDHIIAFMVLEKFHQYEDARNIVIYPRYSVETAVNTQAITNISKDGLVTKPDGHPESPGMLLEWVDPTPACGRTTIKAGQALKCGFGWAPRSDGWVPKSVRYFTEQEIELWNRAAAFIERQDGLDVQLPQALHPRKYGPRYAGSQFHNALNNISSNFPRIDSDESWLSWFGLVDYFFELPVFGAVAVFLPVVYGGIHLAAWKFDFPTKTELLLWKIACFDVMITVPVLLLFTGIWIMVENASAHLLSDDLLNILLYPCLLMYGASRSYLVVESFASLRHVPIGVYWTPSWLQMLPHI